VSVEISGAVKRFGGQAAVDGIEAEIATGEFFAVLGPSGCGKSTLLRLIAGLEPLDAGEIRLDGEVVSAPGRHLPPEARRVGVVFQSYALWPHMSVQDNVAFPLECEGQGRRAARAAAMGHLQTVSLSGFAARPPAELSGGQRQRVALARCLAGRARTILMDEPLANLDPHLRGRMEAEIAAFHRRSGAATIYITHDQREAMALADRIAVMQAGRFVQVGAPEAVHDRPASAEVARFIGQAAVLAAEVRREGAAGRADLGPLAAPAPPDAPEGAQQVVIRPGDVTLGAEGTPARIAAAFYRGGAWEGLAEVPGLAEPLPVRSNRRLVPEQAVRVALGSLWVLPA